MSDTYIRWPSSSGNGVPIYSTFSAFPAGTIVGGLAVAADTGNLYEWDGSGWQQIGGPSSALTLGNLDAQSPTAQGAALVSGVLSMQSATVSDPGLVNISAQTFGGQKTKTNPISLADGSNINATFTGPGASGYQTWYWENPGSTLSL